MIEGSTTQPGPFLEATDVWKSYRRGPEEVRALAGVSLALRPGEVVVLIGRSGSGKTTLLNVLCGWERPDRGEVAWTNGASGRRPANRKWSDLALVPQGLGLLEELSVAENVELPMRLSADGGQPSPGQAERRVAALLRALGLEGLADRSPPEISMGEQQRTALARSLILVPTLLLADEPTGHQDEGWARRVLELIRVAAARGVCCLVATHNTEAIRIADRVLHIRDGVLSAERTDVPPPQGERPAPRGRLR